jgi:hypothetical protein
MKNCECCSKYDTSGLGKIATMQAYDANNDLIDLCDTCYEAGIAKGNFEALEEI